MDDTRIIDLYWQRSERAIAETDAKYGAYCRMVALNLARRRGRAKRGGGEYTLALEELGECAAADGDPAREVERRELVRAIDAFLARLPVEERRVFVAQPAAEITPRNASPTA